jgi:hypothetical protein
MTYNHTNHRVVLIVDRKPVAQQTLVPEGEEGEREPVVRIGYGSATFPDPTYFDGRIAEVRFYQWALNPKQIAALPADEPDGAPAVARWRLDRLPVSGIGDETGRS